MSFHSLLHSDLLFFLHIPKTAGTTFAAILQAQFRPEQICPFTHRNLAEKLATVPPEEKAKYRYFSGHQDSRSVEKILAPHQPRYITMLRDPIARTISAFEHVQRMGRRKRGEERAAQPPLAEFLRRPDARQRFHNRQTRQIAGAIQGMSTAELATTSDADLLAMAKMRLENFAFVGLTEQFRASMRLLSHTFRWRECDREISHLNTAPADDRHKRADLPPETLEVVTACNQLDLQLYRHAKELVGERIRKMEDSPLQRLHNLAVAFILGFCQDDLAEALFSWAANALF